MLMASKERSLAGMSKPLMEVRTAGLRLGVVFAFHEDKENREAKDKNTYGVSLSSDKKN